MKYFLKILLGIFFLPGSCASLTTQPFIFSDTYEVGDSFMGIRLHGTLKLPYTKVNGIKLTELSGLAWDNDEALLYAINDRGYLFHLRPIIERHTLVGIKIITAYPLLSKKGKRLWLKDSEGLSLLHGENGKHGDSELIISFERQASIISFTPQGQFLKVYPLPKVLRNMKAYSQPNVALEAVTWHPKWGILTTPERPLKGHQDIIIYSLTGNTWHFPLHSAPKSSVVALETLDDGSLLVLERAFVSVWQPFIVSLRQVWLGNPCQVKLIAELNNRKGWRLDNFEGLTHHQGHHFFMVSDDNESFLQDTLLSYFELLQE